MNPSSTILIVDDEPGILETYEAFLRPEKPTVFKSSRTSGASVTRPAQPEYELLLAKNGEEAIELVASSHRAGRRIAAGFFDMKMPGGIDGFETIRRVRAIDPDILCTVVTAYQDRSIEELRRHFEGGREDELDYLSKPFSIAEIQQKAKNLVAGWNRRRREEQQREDLERLIGHLTDLQSRDESGLFDMFGAVLGHLVAFTRARGGFVATLEPHLVFRSGTGSLASADEAMRLVQQSGLGARLEEISSQRDPAAVQDVTLVPLICVHAPRVIAALHVHSEPGYDALRLVRVFAENCTAALDKHALFRELGEANTRLEHRVAERTRELTQANAALERKTAELSRMLQSLRDTERLLAQRDKLAAIGQLAAGVAHEVNNPATYVIANIDEAHAFAAEVQRLSRLAREGAASAALVQLSSDTFARRADEVLELTNEAQEGMRRIVKIVKELRTFARHGSGAMEAVDIEKVIDEVLAMLGNELRHKAVVERRFGRVPEVCGDADRLRQVFVNLVVNALHALRAEAPKDNQLRVETWEVGDKVNVSVIDNGAGIPAAQLDHVFDPFFTTKSKEDGTGLGLSIVRDIVHQHGGTIALQSEVGRGTRFDITLPRWRGLEDQPTPAPITSPRLNAVLDRRRLLLIDDDASVLTASRRLLQRHYEVVGASGGAQALALLEHDKAFDAILCDVMMPEMSGESFQSKMLELFPALEPRIIFVTGGAFSTGAAGFCALNRDRILEKPFDLARLQAKVDEVRSSVGAIDVM